MAHALKLPRIRRLLMLLAWTSISASAFCRDSVVVFNEVHYHPRNDGDLLEYVELHNQLAFEVDMSNWRIDGDIDFDFPEGTILPGRGYLVIAKDPAALSSATGHSGALGPFNRSLSNSGGTIRLYNNKLSFRSQSGTGSVGAATSTLEGRRIMDELSFGDNHPWPVGPDASGFSLAKRDPERGTAAPENWTVSTQLNGTPGSENTFASLRKLSFNEVTSSLDADFQLEIHNHGDTPVALGGLVIGSSDELSPDYLLPALELEAHGFLAIDALMLGFVPADNDRLFLHGSGKATLIDAVRVDDTAVARAPDGTGAWSRPTTMTLGSENDVSFEDAIVINEIFYHAKAQLESGGTSTTNQQVLDYSSTWRYNLSAGAAGLPSGWSTVSHPVDGNDWASGPGLLGFENTPLGEPLQTSVALESKITYYFETDFIYNDPETVTEMVINHYVDDGAVFYLNGVEIGRFNMEPGTVTPNTVANPGVGNASLHSLVIPTPNVQAGSNRLSVEVHQINTGSSDIVFGANVVLRTEQTSDYTPFLERDEEWLELHNRSAAVVDLSSWALDGGIRFDFPSGTTIAPGGYLVVAKDSSALLAKHPSSPVIGDYSGRLGNGGDEVILRDAHGNIADEVNYYGSGHWHPQADGGGSSLELRDPDADNSISDAWQPSHEWARNTWQTYSYEAVATDNGIGDNLYHELQIGLLDSGELLIDDLSVLENNSTEFIQNGDFESDAVGAAPDKWRAIGSHGSHGKTVVISDPDDPGNKCLHVVSTGPTENKHNKLETTFANGEEVVPGNTYRITFRAKWLSGCSQLNTRLYFNYLQRTHALDSAEIWGTPGTINTAAIPNAGPDLSGLNHSPAVPDPGEPVTVSILADDPDGISGVTLHYSVNEGPFLSTPMTSSHGRFTGTIPGQSASAIVRFYALASDDLGMTCLLPPAGSQGGAFFKVQDGFTDTSGVRHNLRIIMSASDRDFLFLDTNRMSNDRFSATVIEDEETVYYDVELRLKASAHGRYQSGSYGFNLRFQPDRRFRGVHDSISVERGGSDRQILAKTLTNRAGGGYWSFYDDVSYVIPPTANDRGVALLALSRHTSSYWDGLFPDADESGTLFNLELHYSPNGTTGGPEDLKIGNPYNHTNGQYRLQDRGDDKEPYRWGFQIRSARERDDYSRIIELNQAVGNLSGSELKNALDSIIDVNQWMRTFAMMSLNGTDDVYSRIWEHNFRFFVRPTDGKIIIMQWDLDRSFRLAAGSSVIPTVNKQGTPYPVAKIFSIPEYRRLFDGHLNDLVQTTFNSDYVSAISGGLATGIGSGVNFTNYVTNRANYVLSTLPAPISFEITTNSGADFSEADSVVDLSGSGSHDVFSIEVNGMPTTVNWTGTNSWHVSLPIGIGPNPLTFTAKNHHGVEVGSDSITVTNTSSIDLADAGNTILSEFHYHPGLPSPAELAAGFTEDNDFEFIELMNTSASFVEYTNVRFTDGVTFTMPPGTVLAPGERIILVPDQAAFEFRYGIGTARIGGVYTGKLSNGGERIHLVAADGSTIVDFTYSDALPWPGSPDGEGYSLVLRGSTPGTADHWRPSIAIDGNPGNTDAIHYAGGSLVDYLLVGSPTPHATGGNFQLEFTIRAAADDATFEVHFSSDLDSWTPATEANRLSRTDHPDGTSTLLYETPIPMGDGLAHFGRVSVAPR
ncbi:lamin tail domain-containing protein [Haloferula rosea]|uniref:Lamin tail domain-containing protein n=1 Tax=Haloferula rosea TaxID=490093 RepID=A0A934VG38_9BACT|nr:lamin tail domain-containing protein [Haloferula rosea]MBK1827642.1 lamin tail domain-containing protein [Haloferula rosea]